MNALGSTCLGCLFGCLIAAPAVAVSAPPSSPVPPQRIHVVADNNFPPYLFVDRNGKPQGYAVDAWRLFEAHTGIQVDLEPMGWADARQALESGRADVLDMVYRTPSREALYEFSTPYATVPINIYADRQIRGLHDAASLRGFPVAVEHGDACAEKLRSDGITDLREFPDYRDITQAAAQGSVRVFCMGENPANFFLYQHSIRDRFDPAFTLDTEPLHRAVRKGNASMLAAVEHGMALITPAERATLRKRWLAQPDDTGHYLRAAGIALAVVLALVALMALWVWSLRRTVERRTRELKAGAAKLRALFDASPDAMTVKDEQGIYVDCNDSAVKRLGFGRDKIIGHTTLDVFGLVAGGQMQALDEEVQRLGQPRIYPDPYFPGNDDGPRYHEMVKVPLRLPDGTPNGLLTIARDITERRHAESELRLAAAAFETQEAMMVTDPDAVIQRVNDATVRLTGYAPAELVGQPTTMLRSQQHDDVFYRQVREQIRATGMWQGELWVQGKHGGPKVVRAMVSRVTDADGQVTHYVSSMVDLTSERIARASIDHMTFFDPVTDLPNRFFLHGRLQHMLDGTTGTGGALLLIDLDHFKRINDLRGHAVGDGLLALIAQRLREGLDERCTLGRFGGGTFALLEACGEGAHAAEHAWVCAKQVREALRTPFVVGEGAPVGVTVSIGWTQLVPGHGTPDSVLKKAELAMYAAKSGGRDQTREFRPSMHAKLQRRETLAHELRDAIADNRLDFQLQPQVDRDSRVTGAEMLLRWSRPNGEAVSPAVFIPIAEDSGLILALGDWVIERACELLARWAAHPQFGGLSVAINVSARQFSQRGFVDGIRHALAASRANPARLTLEITESMVLGDIPDVAATLAQLQAMGIRIALDDFGTGYSSLTYLSRLPLDQLKIDQSFVAHLSEDANDSMVAQTIITMGRGLGMEVVAEGVETQAQMDFLMAHACDAFQGYLIARPMSVAAFEALAETRTTPA